jgi:squalene-associated FAD-dependent desaturase
VAASATRVAIVGAGLAGLSAAIALKSKGHEVELFERTRLLGGRATSFSVDGHEVDNGQHVFLACCTAFIRFVEQLGMADSLHLQERFDVLVIGKDVRSRLRAADLPAPLHLGLSLLRYAPLKIGARLGVGRALLGLRKNANELPDETFSAWLARNGQGAAEVRAFWDPFLVPALNVPLGEMRLRDAAFVLQTAFLRDARAARFGWSTVPLARIAETAASRLDRVHISTPVTSLELGGAQIGVRLANDRLTFDKVVLAVPPAQAARLSGIAGLDAYEPHGILDIHLWTDSKALDFDFAALLDSPVQWVFQKDSGYLCCSLSAADDYLTATTASLVERTWDELCAALPALSSARIVQSAVTRNPTATYMPRPGVQRPRARTQWANFALAGSWLETGWPDTMESAVRSGLEAAEVLA